MIAPPSADALMSAPVFCRCMARSVCGVERQRMAGYLSGGLQVDHLSANHPGGRRRRCHDTDRCDLARDHRRVVRARLARHQRERLALQRIAGKDGDAVTVDGVQRRSPAPQAVVVHCRQVVVDQRVGVNELDGARRGQRKIEGTCTRPAGDRVTGGNDQHRAQPFAARRAGCSASPRKGETGSRVERAGTGPALPRHGRAHRRGRSRASMNAPRSSAIRVVA